MLVEERFEVNAAREKVWEALRDPALMLPCIPGCEGIETQSETRYTARLAVAVGPVKAGFELEVEILEERRPEELVAALRGEEGSRASQVRATNTVRLREIDATTTEVYYASEVTVTGRLGRFGLGMMRKSADRLAAQFAQAFTGLVEAGQA